MTAPFYDSHNHLHDSRLDACRDEFSETRPTLGISGVVVNGTSELDWDVVSKLAAENPWIIPSYGLHPWFVRERSEVWKEQLLHFLDKDPRAGVGECGLDRWIEGYDIHLQSDVFRWQLEIATSRDRALSIHCIRAWGALLEILQSAPLPARGFLLHAYGGPQEMVPAFAELGAYFSFSPYFLHPRKSAQRDVFRQIPADRLLVETDAPDMAPPPEANPNPVAAPDGLVINHPANLITAYHALAELRDTPLPDLTVKTEQNWQRLFCLKPIGQLETSIQKTAVLTKRSPIIPEDSGVKNQGNSRS